MDIDFVIIIYSSDLYQDYEKYLNQPLVGLIADFVYKWIKR